ncbi:MAG: ABC transporter permease [Deltaproteobacteria bacterium]|nr:ABC transporter permease [Deltaproteobacteria bacterium]
MLKTLARPVAALGRFALDTVFHLGRYSILSAKALFYSLVPPWRLRAILKQMEFVGVDSLLVVILTGVFTGGVFTLQIIYGFRRFSAESMVGPTVATAMTRELGPVLTALMVTGRVGSAMAAELSAMKVTEQIDALTVMAAEPVKYLISPRIIAGILMLPLLTAVADAVGVVGGYFVAMAKGLDPGQFAGRIQEIVVMDDVFDGLVKSAVFGFILTSVGCYMGYYCKGGAAGVGKSTTVAVVISYVSILVGDFIMTALMY